MAESTAVHSNAFSFTSYLSAGVDPRTGHYTFSANLPGLNCNFLQGPVFDLALFYSPLNTLDSGYGMGWTLRLTQFDTDRDILSLSTGGTFKVTAKEPGKPWKMKESKLDTFHLYPHGTGRYRIVHRSGVVEVLQPMFSRNIAVPVEIYSEQGHGIYLQYQEHNGFPLLTTVTDDEGQTVLSIERTSTRVHAQSFPDLEGAEQRMAFTLVLGTDNRVDQVVLPTQEQASWRFTYQKQRDLWCVVKVGTPTGAVEELRYEDEGHGFPGNAPRTALPRVTRHLVHPGSEQPVIDKRYTYELDPAQPDKHNFLGYGLALVWQDDGLDNLLRHVGKYNYGSMETWHAVDDKGTLQPVRTITRTYDQFHLQVAEKTVQGDNVHTRNTTYNLQFDGSGNLVDFAQQPANCQLPTRQADSWWLASASAKKREEQVLTRYDGFGNLLEQTDVNGVKLVQAWYGASGEDGHESDAEGFVRHLKEKTVVPAASGQGTASSVTTRYRYTTLPALDGNGGAQVEVAPWYATEEEDLVELTAGGNEQLWSHVRYEYETDKATRWTYGRPARMVRDMAGGDLTTRYRYSQVPNVGTQLALAGGTVLQTEETLIGSVRQGEDVDSSTRLIIVQHSVLLDEPLLTRDDNNVEIRYEYDALHRVIAETVAPDQPEQASRRYEYTLCANDDEQAIQLRYDVKSVATRTEFDGLNRPVAEHREDPDALMGDSPEMHPVYGARYNGLGELVEQVDIDWIEKKLLPLTTVYRYDDWGQQCCVIGPDGVHEYQQTDPVGVEGHDGVVTRAWKEVEVADGTGARQLVKSGVTQTWMNLFDKPVRTERFDLGGKSISLQVDLYDGLGRHTRETIGQRINEFSYDIFERLLSHKLPGGSEVVRAYATHSSEDLPISIKVAGTLLGEQSFDGLGRMASSTTGGRKKRYAYDQSQLRPKTVTMTSGAVVEYRYNPALIDDPVYRELMAPGSQDTLVADEQNNYDYDKQNGLLLACDTPQQSVQRSYYSTGNIKEETRVYRSDQAEDERYAMTYVYSLKNRLSSYQDVLGGLQRYEYDDVGRLSRTVLGSTSARFSYDAFGRTHTTTTEDGDQRLVTTLTYDEFDRETLREFTFSDGTRQSLTQVYNDIDNMLQRTLREGTGILRDEFYTYDTRNRLTIYECKGIGDAPALQAPVDPWGNVIAKQVFVLDALDNITAVTTTDADGNLHRTRYLFENADPAQLSGIVHRPFGGDSQTLTLQYDANGNMTLDDAGRSLSYDGLNRLLEVISGDVTQSYHYDAQDVLTGTAGAT